MGFPVVTRLGVNQFWYYHWYNDISYGSTFQTVNIAEKYLTAYLQLGLYYKVNPLFHEYWYGNAFKKLRTTAYHRYRMKFFRKETHVSDSVHLENVFLIRNESGEYFPMRTWIFRFANWIIFSVHWFKPVKRKKAWLKKIVHPLVSASVYFYKTRINKLNRYKLYYELIQNTSYNFRT